MSLEGKVALVTGASRGIGKAIALGIAEAGTQVIGTATTDKGAESITAYFKQAGLKGLGRALNVTDRDVLNDFIASIKSEFGIIEILVNNAAVTRDNLMLRMSEEEWQTVINTNLNAVFHVTKLCLRDMVKARFGRIINLSSVVGITGNPGQANYCAAKAGLLGFSKSLALEVASRGITVNAIAPGFIDTDMTKKLSEQQREALLKMIPMHRAGQPEDVAAVVKFLVSEAASYITGQTFHVNGGMYMG